jgi:hypothetical protein
MKSECAVNWKKKGSVFCCNLWYVLNKLYRLHPVVYVISCIKQDSTNPAAEDLKYPTILENYGIPLRHSNLEESFRCNWKTIKNS